VSDIRLSKLRTWVALVAAYAFALQAILTGLATAQMTAAAGGDLSAICLSMGGDGEKPASAPLSHQSCVVVCATTAAVSLPAQAVAFIAPQFGAAIEFGGLTERAAHVSHVHSPRSSQGPPSVA
jgi:hypothetical protein